MKTLIIALFALFTTVVYADLYEDQFNTLQGQYNNAIKEYNRKYATALQPMLEKAQKDGNVELYNKIRQTLFDIGHPIDADWFVGTWEIEDNDGGKVTRIYEVYTNNMVKYFGRKDNYAGGLQPGTVGKLELLNNNEIKLTFGEIIIVVTKKGNSFTSARWKGSLDFPHSAKAINSTNVIKLK
jgi:hypothetical protein